MRVVGRVFAVRWVRWSGCLLVRTYRSSAASAAGQTQGPDQRQSPSHQWPRQTHRARSVVAVAVASSFRASVPSIRNALTWMPSGFVISWRRPSIPSRSTEHIYRPSRRVVATHDGVVGRANAARIACRTRHPALRRSRRRVASWPPRLLLLASHHRVVSSRTTSACPRAVAASKAVCPAGPCTPPTAAPASSSTRTAPTCPF